MSTTNRRFRFFLIAVATVLFFGTSIQHGHARAKYLFKVGSLAPEGSVWINQFKAFSDDVSKQTAGEVAFRAYPGGTMGDDLAMYRKMRVGQLNGGGFTMSGISSIVPDFRVLAIPFLFDSYDEVDYVKERLIPAFKEKFAAKGLVFLSLTEVGFVYPMSNEPIRTLDALKTAKNWTPTGDPLASMFLQEMGITPTQLTLPDVHSSLQTGLVDTVYNSLYGAIVLQWFTSVKYVCTVPYGYAYGAVLLDGKKFKKLPEEYQEIILATADKYFIPLNDSTRQNNHDSKTILEENGLQFVEPEPSAVQELKGYRDAMLQKATGKLFSKEIFNQTEKLLNEYRSNK